MNVITSINQLIDMLITILGEYRRCKSPSFYESKVTL